MGIQRQDDGTQLKPDAPFVSVTESVYLSTKDE